MALLSEATSALHAGRASNALVTLAEHQRRFPRGVLSQQRQAARAQALCQLGRYAEARAELGRVAKSSPTVRAHQQSLMRAERIAALFSGLSKEKVRLYPTGSIDAYHEFVAGIDVGIAPLEDSGFNRCRSDVKFLKYALHGAVAF